MIFVHFNVSDLYISELKFHNSNTFDLVFVNVTLLR
jgi:hypothetical protein